MPQLTHSQKKNMLNQEAAFHLTFNLLLSPKSVSCTTRQVMMILRSCFTQAEIVTT